MNFRRSLSMVAAIMGMSALAFAAPDGPIEKYDVAQPKISMRAGAARVVVAAPKDVVRSMVLDYGKYSGHIKAFDSSKVVGKSGDKTDVYLRVPIMKGAAKIWAVVRFDPLKADGETELVTARMVKGNVKRLDAVWRIRAVDEQNTELKLELLIIPDFPAPESMVVPEVRNAAARAVRGIRNAAEQRVASR
jgi:ribosome-associated toxin RatA of RatAB toxin-antitoxin module